MFLPMTCRIFHFHSSIPSSIITHHTVHSHTYNFSFHCDTYGPYSYYHLPSRSWSLGHISAICCPFVLVESMPGDKYPKKQPPLSLLSSAPSCQIHALPDAGL